MSAESAGDRCAEGVWSILRALLDIREGEFRELSEGIVQSVPQPTPERALRIYGISDTAGVYVVLGVNGQRADKRDVTWSLVVKSFRDHLDIQGAVEVSTDTGSEELFHLATQHSNPIEAAVLVRRYASELSNQLSWIAESST